MPYLIRKAHIKDVPRLAALLGDYMRETYRGEWGGNTELLEQHLADKDVQIIVREAGGEVIAFISWTSCYDLHWCMKGGMIIDLYVTPRHRGRGAAVLLATSLAKEIMDDGGTFIKGGPVESQTVHRLYSRIAMRFENEGDYHVSGRAFRHLAELQGKNLREIVRNLPEPAWNHET
jgi:ribosomal protein S18 acetylase RimI-like enzyme